jgi:hypothetical protein
MGLQKHEQLAVRAMLAVAEEYEIEATQARAKNTKHPHCVVFRKGENTVSVSIPSSPKDKTWCVRKAAMIGRSVCRDLVNGLRPMTHQHI